MHTGIKSKALSAFVFLMSTGCVVFESSIRKDDIPTGGDAYIYGRFAIDTKTVLGLHANMGIDFACKNADKIYTIGLSLDEPIQVIKLPGGDICSMNSITFTRGDHELVATMPLPSRLRRAVHFDAGKAYYVGDFFGVFRHGGTLHWELTDVQNNYAMTTAQMQSIFRNMSAVPTEDKMLR